MKNNPVFKVFSMLLALCGICDLVYLGYSIADTLRIPAIANGLAAGRNTGFYLTWGLLFTIAAAKLLAGILGLRFSAAPERIGTCAILGSIAALLSAAGIWYSTFLSSKLNQPLLCAGLILSALYIVSTSLSRSERERQLQRAAGITLLAWCVFDMGYAIYILRMLLVNYQYLTSVYSAMGKTADAALMAQFYATILPIGIVFLLHTAAEALTGMTAVRSCAAPQKAGICLGLGIAAAVLNIARLVLLFSEESVWIWFSVSLVLCVSCIVSSMLFKKADSGNAAQ